MKKRKTSVLRRKVLKTTGLTLCSAFLGGIAGSVTSAETTALLSDSNLEPPPVAPEESRASQVEWYMRRGLSGGRAILAVYGDIFGVPRDIAVKISGGFSGGIGHTGEVCSTIIGAVMLLGLKYESAHIADKESHKKTIERTKEFLEDFRARHQTALCRELLPVDLYDITSTPERYAKAHEDGVFDICFRSAKTIVNILENKYNILNLNKNKENTL